MSGRSTSEHSNSSIFTPSVYTSSDSLDNSSDALDSLDFNDLNTDLHLISALISTESHRQKLRYDLPKIIDNYLSLLTIIKHIKEKSGSSQQINRIVFVGVISFPLILENVVNEFIVEIVISFTYHNQTYYLIHLGLSRGSCSRHSNKETIEKDLSFLSNISSSPRYRPLRTEEMVNFLRNQNVEMILKLVLITPQNIQEYYPQIVQLVNTTYRKKQPQMALFIQETCGKYLYAGLVNQNNQLMTLNGFKTHEYDFLKIGELFASLTTDQYKGFSIISTRMLLEYIHNKRIEVDLIITFSRLGHVMKRNRRLGMIINPKFLLPLDECFYQTKDVRNHVMIDGKALESRTVAFIPNLLQFYLQIQPFERDSVVIHRESPR